MEGVFRLGDEDLEAIDSQRGHAPAHFLIDPEPGWARFENHHGLSSRPLKWLARSFTAQPRESVSVVLRGQRRMSMAFGIEGAVVLITGGNTGIGKATAVALAKKGARVVITSRDASRGKIALDEIRGAAGRDDVELIGLDLARLSSVRRCAEEFAERFDRLDVLVNNAGVALTRGLRQETHDSSKNQKRLFGHHTR